MPIGGVDPAASANDGWSPVFSLITDSARRVLKVTDWTGGEGSKPAINVYVTVSGLTGVLGDAIDIRGAAGATGSTGATGTNGATWFSGSGVPSNGTGANGDYYFRTTTNDVYLKASGAWNTPIANLKGDDGPAGTEFYPGVAFVRTTGTDATAVVGYPAQPFLTPAAALATSSNSYDFGTGDWDVDLTGAAYDQTYFKGPSPALCSITVTGCDDAILVDVGHESFTLHVQMNTGGTLRARHAYCGTLDGAGTDGVDSVGAVNGTDGYAGATFYFDECSIGDLPDVSGGDGGDAQNGSLAGNGGDAGDVTYHGCKFRGSGSNAAGNTVNVYSGPETAHGGDGGDDPTGIAIGGNGGAGSTVVRRHCSSIVTGQFATASGVSGGVGGTSGAGNGSTGTAGTVANKGFNTGSAFSFATY